MSNRFDEIAKLADRVRHIDLCAVMRRLGCQKDPRDKAKWHTCRGVISVNGHKFMNWSLSTGGGGAIDLVIHLQGFEFKNAVFWLRDNFAPACIPPTPELQSYCTKRVLKLPQRDDRNLPRVVHYLTHQRCIPEKVVNNLVESGKLYADAKANAVFLLLGKKKSIVGAELRGTRATRWRGMAPGSKKNQGCFYILGQSATKMVLCESAIDAASCVVLHPQYTAISTSGATTNPAWLRKFLEKGCQIHCGFDSDNTGNHLADQMMKLYPSIKRLRPSEHDWNEVLQKMFSSRTHHNLSK
jgi:5S rRNA maturation endonuclease (ribonuclease M5)